MTLDIGDQVSHADHLEYGRVIALYGNQAYVIWKASWVLVSDLQKVTKRNGEDQ